MRRVCQDNFGRVGFFVELVREHAKYRAAHAAVAGEFKTLIFLQRCHNTPKFTVATAAIFGEMSAEFRLEAQLATLVAKGFRPPSVDLDERAKHRFRFCVDARFDFDMKGSRFAGHTFLL